MNCTYCINAFMNFYCTTYIYWSILPFITLAKKILSKYCIERVLDTATKSCHFFHLQKNFVSKCRLIGTHSNLLRNIELTVKFELNFHFDLSFDPFSKRGTCMWLFRRDAKWSQGRCAPPHTSFIHLSVVAVTA